MIGKNLGRYVIWNTGGYAIGNTVCVGKWVGGWGGYATGIENTVGGGGGGGGGEYATGIGNTAL